MKTRSFLALLFLASFLLRGAGGPALSLAQTLPTYTAGVMTKSYDERRAKALEKFEEIIGKYIEERAGIKIRLKAFTYPDLAKAIEKGNVDFIWGYGLVVSMELRPEVSPFTYPHPHSGRGQAKPLQTVRRRHQGSGAQPR